MERLESSRTRQNSLEIIIYGNMAEQCVALSEEERDTDTGIFF